MRVAADVGTAASCSTSSCSRTSTERTRFASYSGNPKTRVSGNFSFAVRRTGRRRCG